MRLWLETLRAEDWPFERAYQHALNQVEWSHDTSVRRSHHAALVDPVVVDEWRAAYEGAPQTRLAAIVELLEPLLAEPPVTEIHGTAVMHHFVSTVWRAPTRRAG